MTMVNITSNHNMIAIMIAALAALRLVIAKIHQDHYSKTVLAGVLVLITMMKPVDAETKIYDSSLPPSQVHSMHSEDLRFRQKLLTLTVSKNDDWKPPVHDLTPEQLSRLNKSIVKNFLFSNLEDDALNTVLHALQEKSFAKDSTIIKQGDEGDFFYLIERGEVAFFVNDKFVSSASTGASFGELALMYNSARAATVKAKTDVIVWALDRLTFRRILLEVTAKKRLMYEEFLKDVKILSDLSPYQRSKLADALHTEVYPPNSTIVEEGAVGENFYLIESGTAEIYKNNEGFIGSISKGDYFGEIALLNDLPRQASVKAKSTVKVATLGKSGFQRLLGPVVEVLKAQDPRKQENIAA